MWCCWIFQDDNPATIIPQKGQRLNRRRGQPVAGRDSCHLGQSKLKVSAVSSA